jgi:hypothetical protein
MRCAVKASLKVQLKRQIETQFRANLPAAGLGARERFTSVGKIFNRCLCMKDLEAGSSQDFVFVINGS